jgi:hypothetical protein
LSGAVCVSCHSDDTADGQNKGSKFAVSLYILKIWPGQIPHAFRGIEQSEKQGAEGLLEAAKKKKEVIRPVIRDQLGLRQTVKLLILGAETDSGDFLSLVLISVRFGN